MMMSPHALWCKLQAQAAVARCLPDRVLMAETGSQRGDLLGASAVQSPLTESIETDQPSPVKFSSPGLHIGRRSIRCTVSSAP